MKEELILLVLSIGLLSLISYAYVSKQRNKNKNSIQVV